MYPFACLFFTPEVTKQAERMSLTPQELARYQRQMLINGWGKEGQEKLKAATVLIAGAGGLGSPAAIFLAAAGVGTLRMCDLSQIYPTNLNRQILYRDAHITRNKVDVAGEMLTTLNPHTRVEPVRDAITTENISDLAESATIILDCLDNFTTRHILNRYAITKSIPLIYAGVENMEGLVCFINPPETPCLQCIFPEDLPGKKFFPIAGAASGFIGTLQACEALKWITGIGDTLAGKLLMWDGTTMQCETIEIKKNPDCPACG